MDDEELERYVAEFQPRPVRALKIPRQIGRVQMGWIAAASFVFGVALWYLLPQTRNAKDAPAVQQSAAGNRLAQKSLNSFALTRLALEDEEHFEAVLAEASRTALPSFARENSALRILAKE